MKLLSVYIQHPKVSLDRPFSYCYSGPEEVKVGFRVLLSFHNQSLMGYVSKVEEVDYEFEQAEEKLGFPIREIISIVDKAPLLNDELMMLSEEISEYYYAPRISVLQAMLPQSLSPKLSALKGPKIAYEDWAEIVSPSEEGLSSAKQKELLRLIASSGPIRKKDCGSPSSLAKLVELGKIRLFKQAKQRYQIPEFEKEQPHDLTPIQQEAKDYILNENKSTILLEGVTGSGKTEVYLSISESYLKQGKSVLMLVPEISLTPIMVEYFARRFEGDVAILHSELTPAQKYDEYRKIASGQAKIVIGARSAIFAPLDNIGLIILDEEHTESYKQDVLPYYHAREVAIIRAKHFGAKVLLGSATPSLETKARASRGVFGYFYMGKRINERELPHCTIVDLSRPGTLLKHSQIFSNLLISKIREKLDKKEQVVLLINRRGYSSYVTCKSCGHIYTCPDCHSNLTYHKADDMLKCHHCDFVMEYPKQCPNCGSEKIAKVGFGTERICKEIEFLFPEIRIGRLDSDVGKVRNNIAKTLEQFRNQEFDILVGTQMIAKGHDFPNVTLVGLVLADIGLALPSFKASERTYQLIAQAVGRAGRGAKPGEAIIQTYNPTNYAITLGARQDYGAFYKREMQSRHIASYPPFVYLILVSFSSPSEQRVEEVAKAFRKDLDSRGFTGVEALGPTVPYFGFFAGKHIRTLTIKYRDDSALRPYLEETLRILSGKAGVDIVYDVDPQNC